MDTFSVTRTALEISIFFFFWPFLTPYLAAEGFLLHINWKPVLYVHRAIVEPDSSLGKSQSHVLASSSTILKE